MTALQKLLSTYRDAAKSEREKGTYFEELTIAYLRNEATYKDPVQGKEFVNESTQSEQLVETKLIEAGLWKWLIDRHINVQFDDDAGHDYAGKSMPSIDVHTIGLFMESEDLPKTQVNAERMFQLFLPYIKHIQDLKQAMS